MFIVGVLMLVVPLLGSWLAIVVAAAYQGLFLEIAVGLGVVLWFLIALFLLVRG